MATKKKEAKKDAKSRAQGAIAKITPQTRAEQMPSGDLIAIGEMITQAFSDAAQVMTKPKASMAVLSKLRRRIAEELRAPDVPDGNMTPEEYQDMVAHMFGVTLFCSAREPTTMKKEAERFITAVRVIQKGYPKKKKGPGKDVMIAEKILRDSKKRVHQVYEFAIVAEVYGKDWKDMSRPEKTKAARTLRNRLSARASAEKKKMIPK